MQPRRTMLIDNTDLALAHIELPLRPPHWSRPAQLCRGGRQAGEEERRKHCQFELSHNKWRTPARLHPALRVRKIEKCCKQKKPSLTSDGNTRARTQRAKQILAPTHGTDGRRGIAPRSHPPPLRGPQRRFAPLSTIGCCSPGDPEIPAAACRVRNLYYTTRTCYSSLRGGGEARGYPLAWGVGGE